VWRVALSDGKVDALVPMGRAPGANGIAITGDGRAYVGASRRPLRLNIATGDVAPLRFPPRQQAAGIDGLYWYDGQLIGVQNVTNPGRIVRLTLGSDGTSVTRVETLQSHHQPCLRRADDGGALRARALRPHADLMLRASTPMAKSRSPRAFGRRRY
jgi:hypothetical protein